MRKLGGSRYFSKIDLADAFNHIKLAPMSQKKLALTTNRGVLLQTRLPFGIISAPGYFQEIMDKLTCDLQGVTVYLDDILVGGSNSKEHLQNLKALLQRLRDKGLRCNKNKCIFAKCLESIWLESNQKRNTLELEFGSREVVSKVEGYPSKRCAARAF